MKVTVRRGRRTLRMAPDEVDVLRELLGDLRSLVDRHDVADPAVARLYPSAYVDDDVAEGEYRELTESGLRSERVERVEACDDELAGASEVDVTEVDVTDSETATRWIQVLNDLRLAIGIRLGVTEEPPEPDPDDPLWKAYPVYLWLTQAQDKLVTALMA